MWAALTGGVVAYLHKYWTGTPEEAEVSILEHLHSGTDVLEGMDTQFSGWSPMVYAPLDPEVLGMELSRRYWILDTDIEIDEDAFDAGLHLDKSLLDDEDDEILFADRYWVEDELFPVKEKWSDINNAEYWMREFVEILDKTATGLWQRIRKNNKDVILHAAAYNLTVTENPTATKYRLQAFHLYPWLATYLYTEHAIIWRPAAQHVATQSVAGWHRRKILECVDQGQKLIPYLSALLDIPQGALRHSKSLYLTALLRLKADEFLPAFRELSVMKGWPFLCSKGDVALLGLHYWLKSLGLSGIMTEAVSNLEWKPSDLMGVLYGSTRLHIQDIEELDVRESIGTLDAAHDFLRALVRDASHAFDLPDHKIRKAVGQWMSVHGLPSFIKACDEWHERVSQAPKVLPTEPGLVWTPLLTRPIQVGQRVVVELSDENALIVEGAAMRHCVGTFAEKCIRGGSRIFSIRDRAGNRCSTLELMPTCLSEEVETATGDHMAARKPHRNKDIVFQMGQHLAAKNTDPSELCSEAAKHVHALVNSYKYTATRIEITNECLQAQKSRKDKSSDGLALACVEHLFPPFGSFLTARQEHPYDHFSNDIYGLGNEVQEYVS